MPINVFSKEIRKIAENVVKNYFKNNQIMNKIVAWNKDSQEYAKNIKILELRIQKLERDNIQLRKIVENNNMPADVTNNETVAKEVLVSIKTFTAKQAKNIRERHQFSQDKFAKLLGIGTERYRKYEKGQQAIPSDVADNLHNINSLSISDLRSLMVEKDIFQENGIISRSKKDDNLSPSKKIKQSSYTSTELKNLRIEKQQTQKVIAEFIGVKVSTYQCWEQGKYHMPDIYTNKIEALFDMEFPSLVNIIPKQQSPYTATDLKNLRIEKQQTQKVIAEFIGVKVSTYQCWEQGKCRMPDIHTAKVKEIFDMELTPVVVNGHSSFSADDMKTLRKKLNFTQGKMASKICVSTKTYQCWEWGKYKISKCYEPAIFALQSQLDLGNKITKEPSVKPLGVSNKKQKINKIDVTEEVYQKIMKCHELFDSLTQVATKNINMDIKNYELLIKGKLKTIDIKTWNRINFLLDLPANRISKLREKAGLKA